MTRASRLILAALAALALAFAVGACGDDDDEGGGESQSGTVSSQGRNGELTPP